MIVMVINKKIDNNDHNDGNDNNDANDNDTISNIII